jgi:DNA processing protein
MPPRWTPARSPLSRAGSTSSIRRSTKIAARGLLVSERPLGHQPVARDFPRRNRLISGLSRGVIVVEAAERSGTLITARFALEQGREVFAVPGSPLDPRCMGAINLIREGATAIRNAEDVLDSLAEQNRHVREDREAREAEWRPAHEDSGASRELRALVFERLSPSPLHRDELLRDIDAPPGLIADALLELVLAGDAEEHAGGRFALAARG